MNMTNEQKAITSAGAVSVVAIGYLSYLLRYQRKTLTLATGTYAIQRETILSQRKTIDLQQKALTDGIPLMVFSNN